jgi:hypothetical protein
LGGGCTAGVEDGDADMGNAIRYSVVGLLVDSGPGGVATSDLAFDDDAQTVVGDNHIRQTARRPVRQDSLWSCCESALGEKPSQLDIDDFLALRVHDPDASLLPRASCCHRRPATIAAFTALARGVHRALVADGDDAGIRRSLGRVTPGIADLGGSATHETKDLHLPVPGNIPPEGLSHGHGLDAFGVASVQAAVTQVLFHEIYALLHAVRRHGGVIVRTAPWHAADGE